MAEGLSDVQWPLFNEEQACDPQELEINKLLKRINVELSDNFLAAIRVLQDIYNPKRLSQAASSIREITPMLVGRRGQTRLTENEKIQLKKIDKKFNELLEKMPKSTEKKEAKKEDTYVRVKFEEIRSMLVKGCNSLRQKIKAFIENGHSGYPQKMVDECVRDWFDSHNYFRGITHGNTDETTFRDHWQTMKNCLQVTLRAFYQDKVQVLDSLIVMERPPRS